MGVALGIALYAGVPALLGPATLEARTVYEIGVDAPSGVYRTAGGDRSATGPSCFYALNGETFSRNAQDWLRDGVWLRDGDTFEHVSCLPWERQG